MIITGVVLSVVTSYHLLLAFLTGDLAQTWFSRSTSLRLISPLVSGLEFARPVLWAWALVVLVSAAIRRYGLRSSKTAGPEDEKK